MWSLAFYSLHKVDASGFSFTFSSGQIISSLLDYIFWFMFKMVTVLCPWIVFLVNILGVFLNLNVDSLIFFEGTLLCWAWHVWKDYWLHFVMSSSFLWQKCPQNILILALDICFCYFSILCFFFFFASAIVLIVCP